MVCVSLWLVRIDHCPFHIGLTTISINMLIKTKEGQILSAEVPCPGLAACAPVLRHSLPSPCVSPSCVMQGSMLTSRAAPGAQPPRQLPGTLAKRGDKGNMLS